MRISQQRGAGVSAVEAHEGLMETIVELSFDFFVVDVFRNRVVDI